SRAQGAETSLNNGKADKNSPSFTGGVNVSTGDFYVSSGNAYFSGDVHAGKWLYTDTVVAQSGKAIGVSSPLNLNEESWLNKTPSDQPGSTGSHIANTGWVDSWYAPRSALASEVSRAQGAESELQSAKVQKSGDTITGDLHISGAWLYTDTVSGNSGDTVRFTNRAGVTGNAAFGANVSIGHGTEDFSGTSTGGYNPIYSWTQGWFYSGGGVYQYNPNDVPLYIGTGVNNGAIVAFYTQGQGASSIGSIVCRGSTVQYVTTSDYRLKENVETLSSDKTKDVLDRLRPVEFDWKIDGRRQAGFIAHELSDVLPNAVVGKKDDVDDDGNVKPQHVDTSEIIPYLVSEVQALRKEVSKLRRSIQ
ncbi:hypothetical protein AD940_00435, partial [Gluconobacter thailandicus]|uniref:tail fiber domain-containing protein n=1 Tax=Gluconobacter thailandicus TaxID=257438 RepID=UPI0007942CF4